MNIAYQLPFKKIGRDVVIWERAKIVSPEVISIGNSVIIDDFVFLMGGAGVYIGNFVHIASFTSVTGGGQLVMEDFSGLSSGCRIFTGTEDYSGEHLTNPTIPAPYRVPERSFVHIKRHAIIGANSVILPGVTIGEGVVVAAGSVVVKDCLPWRVYAGVPARPVKPRPKERLLELEQQLRAKAYTPNGEYIPKALWSK